MPGNTHIHSIDAYTLSFAGLIINNGAGDGGFVEVEFPQKFDSKSGMHGDIVTYKMGDEVSTVRITLLQQSTYNEQLAEIHAADVNSNAGAGVGSLMLEDLNTDLEISGDARIIQPPTFNIQAEAQEVVWTLHLFHSLPLFRPRGSSVSFGFGVDISASIGFSF